MKTNAARILERLEIAFELREYPIDPEDLSAERAAEKLGMEPRACSRRCKVAPIARHKNPK